MILGLYLITPILRAFCDGANRGDFHWFFLLCFLFASLLPTAFRLWPNSTAVIQVWYDRLDIQLVMGYVGYYVAGYYLREFVIGRIAEAVIYVLGVLGAVGPVWGPQRLSGVARISFGIYLVHDLFIMLLRFWGITTLTFSPVASVPILTAVVFLCSFAVAWLISKIPFVGRWLT